ncbi:MAG: O-antigen ligase family protein [Bacillota bacterium]
MTHDQLNLKIKPLEIFFIIIPLWQGLYYSPQFVTGLIILGVIILVGLVKGNSKGFRLFYSPIIWGAIAISICYSLSTVSAINSSQAWIEFIRSLYGPIILVASSLYLTKRQKADMWRWIFWSATIVAALGICALLGLINWPGMVYDGRLQSTLQYANATADLLMIAILIGLALRKTITSQCHLYYCIIVFLVIGLIATGSRTVLVISLPLFILNWVANNEFKFTNLARVSYKQIVFVLVVLLLAVMLIYLFQWRGLSLSTSELKQRLSYYERAMMIISQHPWLGLGGGGWETAASGNVRWVHSQPLQIAVDAGIPAMFAWIFTFGMFIRSKIRERAVNGYLSTEQSLSLTIATFIFVHSLVDLNLSIPALSSIYWLAICPQYVSSERNALL